MILMALNTSNLYRARLVIVALILIMQQNVQQILPYKGLIRKILFGEKLDIYFSMTLMVSI